MADADRIKWDGKYAERGEGLRDIDPWLASIADSLPEEGRALDVAGGDGRHAIWLAQRGLDVTVVDVSPVGLAAAERNAARVGVSIATRSLDLEVEPLDGRWDLILCFHYLQRELFGVFAERLAPGGLLAFCQPTRRNLERHAHPSARFLLYEGELAGLIPPSLQVLRQEEGWSANGRHEARLLACKRVDRA